MNREMAREQIRAALQAYLEGKGLDTSRAFRCLNPAHQDKHPSMRYDRARGKAHCFACGADYDTIDLIQAEYGLDSAGQAFEKAYEIFGINVGERKKASGAEGKTFRNLSAGAGYLEACAARADQTDYFARRGLSMKTVRARGLGYDPNFKTREGDDFVMWRAVTVPTGGGAYLVRNVDSRGKDDRIRKRGAAGLYNAEALRTSKKPIFVVEGEFDALSVMEVGGEVVALGSVANVEKFLALARESPPVHALVLSLDNDQSGEDASMALLEALSGQNVPCEAYNISGAYNDPNEALVNDRAAFEADVRAAEADVAARALERAEAEREAVRAAYVRENSALSHLTGFVDGIARSVDTPATRTGFAALDAALDGGLYEGLYILGAVSSLGKTSFCLQLADQIAAAGRDVLFFSLEMARSELMARSISRLSYLLSGDARSPKTVRGITDGRRYARYDAKERALIRAAIDAYAEPASHMFIVEGAGDVDALAVREAVKRHVELTGEAPVVFVDYLQLLAPFEARLTDKQNMDRSVLELKRVSRDFKLPLIAISSFNRENYKQAVNMASFKESGAIEYSSDVLIGLQAKGAGEDEFDADEARRRDPREVELVVLKNRNGAAGERVEFGYRPMFNCFYEAARAVVRKRV